MSENLDNPNRSKETDSNQSSSNQKSQWPSSIESNPNPHRPQHKPASPNWVDKCTLIVLVLAFSAAVAAAIEAHRLVTATDRAIEEARTGTGQQIKVLQSQLSTQQTSLEKQISLLDLSTRPILTSNFADWQLNPPLKAGISPTISFSVKNFERSNAQLLSATYQYTIAPQIPVRFGEPKTIKNFPGLLPRKSAQQSFFPDRQASVPTTSKQLIVARHRYGCALFSFSVTTARSFMKSGSPGRTASAPMPREAKAMDLFSPITRCRATFGMTPISTACAA